MNPTADQSVVNTSPKPPVSVVILTMNEAVNLGPCLDSCAWCDDVHVLDSGSTDGTQEIAARRGVPVHTNKFESFGKQRNWAIDHVPTKHDWTFHLDADERFTPEMVAEMVGLFGDRDSGSEKDPGVDAFRVPHKMMLMGTWLRRSEGYPVYQVRLFHRGRMRFIDHGHGQREPEDAELDTLKEPYLHEAYRRGVFDWVERHNVHSQREAEAIVFGDGAEARWGDLFSGDRVVRRRAAKALSFRLPGRPWLRWFAVLFLQRGFLDGPAAWRYADLMRLYDQMTVTKVKMLRAGWRPAEVAGQPADGASAASPGAGESVS
ncbi:MAG: glycosyltransferase family 2 protein [Planctomycetota bacterium]